MPIHPLVLSLLALLPAPLLLYVVGRTVFGAKWNTRRIGMQTGVLFLSLLAFFTVLRCLEPAAPADVSEIETETLPKLSEIGLSDWDLLHWDGSTSLRPLADLIVSRLTGIPVEKMADSEAAFWTRHPFLKTHESIVNVIEGHRDLAFSARKPSEYERRLAGNSNVDLVCTPFARDAFIFLVHENNPVTDLSREQILAIYEGRLTSWSEAAGRAVQIAPPSGVEHDAWDMGYKSQKVPTDVILPLVRNRNSGSEELMRELVMGDTEIRAGSAHVVKSMAGLFNVLEGSANGIGYSLLYFEKHLAPKTGVRPLSIDGVPPSRETVASGDYPYTYECYLIHRKDPGEKVEHFVRWLLEPEGQAVVSESGYVPGRH